MKIVADQTGPKTVAINGNTVEFDYPIQEILASNDIVLILLNTFSAPFEDKEAGRNLLAFNSGAELLWLVEDAGFTALDENDREVTQGYTGIHLKGRDLTAFQPIGCLCTIDLDSGKILASEQTK